MPHHVHASTPGRHHRSQGTIKEENEGDENAPVLTTDEFTKAENTLTEAEATLTKLDKL